MSSNTHRESDLGFTGVALLVLSALVVLWLAAEALIPRAPHPRVVQSASLHEPMIAHAQSARPARSETETAR